MKVAVNIAPLYRLNGDLYPMSGVHHHLSALLTALCPLSDKVEVRAFAPLGNATRLREYGQAGLLPWWSEGVLDCPGSVQGGGGIAVNSEGKPTPLSRLGIRLRLPATVRAAQQYDVMHIAAPSYLPLNKYAPLRTVVTIYDMTTRTHPETHTPQNIAAWEQIFTFAQQRYAPIVTVSEWAKAEICTILQIPTAQVTVISSAPRPTTRHIPPGNEREQLLSVLPEIAESPFVLYAGNVEPRKNLKRLIMAFALAQSERKGIQLHKLVIAGSGSPEYVTELQQVAEESGIADAVVFTGYLSDEILNALMSACSVFAYVSLSEGFGIPPLEAMVCGATVVASCVTSLPEVVGSAGLLVDPTDTDEIATALYQGMTDTPLRASLQSEAKRQTSRFTWEQVAEQVIQVWKDTRG